MKCKMCKFWKHNGPRMGICSGLSMETKVFPLPDTIDKKGNPQKRGKLLRVCSGVISGIGNRVLTPEDWHCKNWRSKC